MAKVQVFDTPKPPIKIEDNTAQSYTIMTTHFIVPDCTWDCYGEKRHSNVAWCAGNVKRAIGPFKEGERINMTVGNTDIFIQGISNPKVYTFVLGKDVKI